MRYERVKEEKKKSIVCNSGSISDEDFTPIMLGSIRPSYDMYITATSFLMNKTLSPTNLIDAIHNEAD
jgi:hypothetical protein